MVFFFSCSFLEVFVKIALPPLTVPEAFSWGQPRGTSGAGALTPPGFTERGAGPGAQVRTHTELQEGVDSLKE